MGVLLSVSHLDYFAIKALVILSALYWQTKEEQMIIFLIETRVNEVEMQ